MPLSPTTSRSELIIVIIVVGMCVCGCVFVFCILFCFVFLRGGGCFLFALFVCCWFFAFLHMQVISLMLTRFVGWLLACLTSLQHASVCQGQICLNKIVRAAKLRQKLRIKLHFTQSQYTDTGPISPSAYPLMPGVSSYNARRLAR